MYWEKIHDKIHAGLMHPITSILKNHKNNEV